MLTCVCMCVCVYRYPCVGVFMCVRMHVEPLGSSGAAFKTQSLTDLGLQDFMWLVLAAFQKVFEPALTRHWSRLLTCSPSICSKAFFFGGGGC